MDFIIFNVFQFHALCPGDFVAVEAEDSVVSVCPFVIIDAFGDFGAGFQYDNFVACRGFFVQVGD